MKIGFVLFFSSLLLFSCKNRDFNSDVMQGGTDDVGPKKFRCTSEEPHNQIFINSQGVILKGSSYGNLTSKSVLGPRKANLRSFDKLRVYNITTNNNNEFTLFISKRECATPSGLLGFDFVAVSTSGQQPNIQGCCSTESL